MKAKKAEPKVKQRLRRITTMDPVLEKLVRNLNPSQMLDLASKWDQWIRQLRFHVATMEPDFETVRAQFEGFAEGGRAKSAATLEKLAMMIRLIGDQETGRERMSALLTQEASERRGMN